MNCNHECNQGRNCTCRQPEEQPRSGFLPGFVIGICSGVWIGCMLIYAALVRHA